MSTVALKHDPSEVAIVTCIRAAMVMSWREIVRFLRQRNRVVGAVGQPVLFWLLFGVGMNHNFQIPGQPFSEYFVSGTLVLILLFTAIFATISIIEDRQAGFLQSVLVAPVARWAFVLGKVVGGSILATAQAILFLLLTMTFSHTPGVVPLILSIALMSLSAIGLTSLGFCLAWRLDSTQGFHAIMNLLLMPMWLLSGAFFPLPPTTGTVSEQLLHWSMRANPVTYTVGGLRQLLAATPIPDESLWLPDQGICWLVTAAFAIAMFLSAVRVSRRTSHGDLR